MKLVLKLNLDNFENQEFHSNEYDTLEPCYREQIIFLKGWLDYTPYAQPLMDHIIKILGEGEKSGIPVQADKIPDRVGSQERDSIPDSNPLPRKVIKVSPGFDMPKRAPLEKTTVVETQNFVDVRECKDYSDKSYKLISYDNMYTFIAKQHVIRTESIEGGGTRVVVSPKSAWVITKLEWK